MNNTMKRVVLLTALALIVAGGAFAQRVGDTVRVGDQNYRITEVNGDSLRLQKMGRYEVVETALTWADAKTAAERRGGHLAVITSAEEQAAIEALLTRGRSYWIGGYCEDDRIFKWVTGERMAYTNWSRGNPNNNNDRTNMRVQDKMHLWADVNWQWDDNYATSRQGYIIEF